MEKLIKGLPRKEYLRQWRLDNPEKVKESQKKWHSKNKEKINEYARNSKKRKISQLRYREARREYYREISKAYRLRKKLEEQNNKTKEGE